MLCVKMKETQHKGDNQNNVMLYERRNIESKQQLTVKGVEKVNRQIDTLIYIDD